MWFQNFFKKFDGMFMSKIPKKTVPEVCSSFYLFNKLKGRKIMNTF